MAWVDDKATANKAFEEEVRGFQQGLRDWLAGIDKPTDEQKQHVRDEIDRLNIFLKENLLKIDRNEWGQNISYRSTEASQQVVYGRCRIGGLISFLTSDQRKETEGGEEIEEGEFLHVVVTYAGHEIWKVQDLYLNGEVVDFGNGRPDQTGRKTFRWAQGEWENLVFCSVANYGTEDQEANVDLVAQSAVLFPNLWTSVHRQRGSASIYLILLYNASKFLGGFPEIAVDVYGKNDIYDPRNDTTAWSNNAALCLANYLCDEKFGPGFSSDEIDWDSFATAANVCDESVVLAGGGTQKKYSINGAFLVGSSAGHQAVINDMLKSMAADSLVQIDGKWCVYPGKWREPVVTLSEKHLRSGLEITARPIAADIFNGVKGKYRGPATQWELSDYPPVTNNLYRSQDGRRLWYELDLPFTDDSTRAQRIAKILLEQSRQWISVSADFSLDALQLTPGDTVNLSVERMGWTPKAFIVDNLSIQPQLESETGPVCHVHLRLRETAAGVYDWNMGEETRIDLAPNTRLPDPRVVAAPTGLSIESGTEQLDIRADGTVFARAKLTWNPSTDIYVITGGRHQIQHKRSVSSSWRPSGYCDGTESAFWILDLQDGQEYDFRVRAVTFFRSDWTTVTNYRVIGKTEPPSTVTGFIAQCVAEGVLLSWNPIPDLDLSAYEIRVGDDWSTGERIALTRATSFLWQTQIAGVYRFYLRAKDTSGNYSYGSAVATLTIAPPGLVQNLVCQSVYNMVVLDWTEPLTWTFPVDFYKIYKGDTWQTAVLMGSVDATFKTFQEFLAGIYTYWVTAVDTAGNEGPAAFVTQKVDAPPLFELLYDQVMDPSDATTLTHAAVEKMSVVAPIDTAITYSAHFTENSWDTPAEQIAAGYPIYSQPTLGGVETGVYEQSIDYGLVLGGALVTVIDMPVWVAGDGTITRTISYSETGASWTDAVDVSQVFASNFRYIKVKYEIDGADVYSVARLPAVRVKIDIKRVADAVILSAQAGDAGGTLVIWNKNFLDVFEASISAVFQGAGANFASFTISDNDVHIYLWDVNGSRVSGNVRVACEGIVADL